MVALDSPQIFDVNCSIANCRPSAFVTVNPPTEVLIFRVKLVQNSVCVDPLRRGVNTYVEVRLKHAKHLEKIGSQEDADLYQAIVIFERRHVSWFDIWSVYL